jgi:TrmH family RNA methyltransferase
MEIIKSRQNEKIRLARALKQRKKRELEGRFLVEGLFHLGEAIEAGAEIDFVLSAPELIRNEFGEKLLSGIEAKGIASFDVDKEILEDLSLREKSSAFLAVCKSKTLKLGALVESEGQRWVALIKPQYPGNLGSILRTVDAAGADGIILIDGGVDAFHPVAIRAGMGSHFWKDIVRSSFDDFVQWAKVSKVQVLGSSAKDGEDIGVIKARAPYVLLMGSEREGLSADQKASCDQLIRMPMRGRSTSLNLSVAAGILLFRLRDMES